jgi:hypothetical protein
MCTEALIAVPRFVGHEVINPRWSSYENLATDSNFYKAVMSLSKTCLIFDPFCIEIILN